MKRNNTSTQGSGVDNRFSTSLDLNDHSSVNKFILERLDDINENNQTAHSGEQLTFTIPQILTALVAVITIGGSGLAAWNNLNNQLITQKISTDLTIVQLQKDIAAQDVVNKELHSKIDTIMVQIQGSIDKLTSRVEELDNTVSQLYNRTVTVKK